MAEFCLRKEPLEQRLACADLTADGPQILARLAAGRRVFAVYSDPPWNPGNEKYWRRYAGMAPPQDFAALLNAWCDAVALLSPAHVLVEQSAIERHRSLLIESITRCKGWTLPQAGEWTVRYGNPKRPNTLLHFGDAPLQTDPSGMNGIAMTRIALIGLNPAPGSLIADPCMGLGTTSRAAHDLDLSCIGTELNPARLQRTVERLKKLGYRES